LDINLLNPYYGYNKIIYFKDSDINNNLKFSLDNNYYLKFTLNITVEYKILIFKITNTFLDTIINFKTDTIIFKIFKIIPPNSNTDLESNVYSILFQNIKECNNFMNYIQYGTELVSNNTKSYFNITKSKNFKKDDDGYYKITDSIESELLYFSIIDLYLTSNTIFLNNLINFT
jgi:hypothetical protein